MTKSADRHLDEATAKILSNLINGLPQSPQDFQLQLSAVLSHLNDKLDAVCGEESTALKKRKFQGDDNVSHRSNLEKPTANSVSQQLNLGDPLFCFPGLTFLTPRKKDDLVVYENHVALYSSNKETPSNLDQVIRGSAELIIKKEEIAQFFILNGTERNKKVLIAVLLYQQLELKSTLYTSSSVVFQVNESDNLTVLMKPSFSLGENFPQDVPRQFLKNIASHFLTPNVIEAATSIKAYRKAQDGHLWLLPEGVLYGLKKPVVFIPSESIEKVEIGNIASRTFELILHGKVDPRQPKQNRKLELDMLDRVELDRVSAYSRRFDSEKFTEDSKGKGKAPALSPPQGSHEAASIAGLPLQFDEEDEEDDEDYSPSDSSSDEESCTDSDEDDYSNSSRTGPTDHLLNSDSDDYDSNESDSVEMDQDISLQEDEESYVQKIRKSVVKIESRSPSRVTALSTGSSASQSAQKSVENDDDIVFG